MKYAEYGPLSTHRRWWGGPRFLRTARLNAAGWTAVAGIGLAGGAVAYATSRLLDAGHRIAPLVGTSLAVGGLVAADRVRWSRLHVDYGWSSDFGEAELVASHLRRTGIDVCANVGDDAGIRYRNRDRRAVRRELSRLGFDQPLPP